MCCLNGYMLRLTLLEVTELKGLKLIIFSPFPHPSRRHGDVLFQVFCSAPLHSAALPEDLGKPETMFALCGFRLLTSHTISSFHANRTWRISTEARVLCSYRWNPKPSARLCLMSSWRSRLVSHLQHDKVDSNVEWAFAIDHERGKSRKLDEFREEEERERRRDKRPVSQSFTQIAFGREIVQWNCQSFQRERY